MQSTKVEASLIKVKDSSIAVKGCLTVVEVMAGKEEVMIIKVGDT